MSKVISIKKLTIIVSLHKIRGVCFNLRNSRDIRYLYFDLGVCFNLRYSRDIMIRCLLLILIKKNVLYVKNSV